MIGLSRGGVAATGLSRPLGAGWDGVGRISRIVGVPRVSEGPGPMGPGPVGPWAQGLGPKDCYYFYKITISTFFEKIDLLYDPQASNQDQK